MRGETGHHRKTGRRWRIARRLLLALPLAVSLALSLWALSQSPFARPLVAATTAEAARALDRAVARRLTPARLEREMSAAVEAEDLDRIDMLLPLAARHRITPSPTMTARIAALRDAQSGLWTTAAACARCIADIRDCPSLAYLGSCGLPVELTPVGDLNALRRAGTAAWTGQEVDRLDVGLAIAGLGGTVAIVASGGSSATVKVGATALRVGRRLGTLTPELLRVLGRLADLDVKPGRIWPWIWGRMPASAVYDTARLGRLGDMAGDMSRVAANTSPAETLLLLRHVDGPRDAARLARVSDAAGPETRATMEVLGKRRAFRALVRVSDLALGAVALLYATLLQAALMVASWIGGRAARTLLRALPGG
ncbi:hypothetical protein E0K89_009735 [Aquicoccus sp. SCR17]|nr:hypothetical protein [Carideicomes alvinocaridis]